MEIVNGFICRDCTDAERAQRHIDPARPQDGPFGAYAKEEPKADFGPAVNFGGGLAELNASPRTDIVNRNEAADRSRNDPGRLVDVFA